MKRAFTILEATIGALMLSCLIAVFADYFVSRTTKARDSEMRTALYALTQSCNNALSNAYATAMQSRMQELVRNKGSISDFTLELPTGTMQDCYAVVRGAFRDYVYYNSSNSEVEDPFNRSYTGAKPIDGLAPLLAIPEELYVNIQYIVQKPNESAVAPDFAATKSSHNPSYAWRFEYLGASHMSFTLYHTLVVTVFTDKDGLDFRAGIPALANYIKDGVINAANVVFTLHTQCEAEGFNMDGFEPMATSGTISSPFSTNLLARFADNPLVDDEQPEVPDVPDLRFARAGFDDLTLSVSFNQGSTPDTTPSGNITLKDLDLRQNITLEEGESVEWSISGSSAVIRGNGTSADIVFSGIDYARLAAGNHDFVETVTAKIIKDGKVIRTITGKVRLGSTIKSDGLTVNSIGFNIFPEITGSISSGGELQHFDFPILLKIQISGGTSQFSVGDTFNLSKVSGYTSVSFVHTDSSNTISYNISPGGKGKVIAKQNSILYIATDCSVSDYKLACRGYEYPKDIAQGNYKKFWDSYMGFKCLYRLFRGNPTDESFIWTHADGFISSGHVFGNLNQVRTGVFSNLVITQNWNSSKISLIK